MPKAHRALLDRVSGYADEAGAFMRRRRHTRRPFARIHYAGGRSCDHASDTIVGAELFTAAGRVIEAAARPED